MDFKQIEAFVNVVRYKNFSKAADATFFSQPTISTHISNLEKELGVALLDRKGRYVEMTPKGETFYKFAMEMINSRDGARDALSKTGNSLSGILEIQTSSIPGVTFVPELLAEFRKQHDKVQYYVTMSDTQSVIDNLNDHRGEIGFVGEKLSSSSLSYTKLSSDSIVMIAPTEYKLPDTISMDEAVKLPFVWRETGSATRKSFENAAAKFGYDKNSFEIAGLFNDLDSIIRSVEVGLGVAIISRRVAESIGGERVKTVEIRNFTDERVFYMVHLKGVALSPSAEAFIEFVENTYNN
ncbi:MAG: LysR family transcriptional regulator [Clostridiales bacterium]|nr:LysR family transcriptional regulator [Candidatus Crickella caballi]